MKSGGILGSSDCEMADFRITQGNSRVVSGIANVGFRRANCGLFRYLLGGIPWVSVLKSRPSQKEVANSQEAPFKMGASQ